MPHTCPTGTWSHAASALLGHPPAESGPGWHLKGTDAPLPAPPREQHWFAKKKDLPEAEAQAAWEQETETLFTFSSCP